MYYLSLLKCLKSLILNLVVGKDVVRLVTLRDLLLDRLNYIKL